MADRFKWAFYRIVFMILGFLCSLTGGLLAYPLAPLVSYYMFNDFNFLKYHRHFIPMAGAAWRRMFILLTDPVYRSVSRLSLTMEPRQAPDPSIVRVTDQWKAGAHDCNKCVKCCLQIKCPLLDREKKRCKSYGSFFWRYFNCGRYPETEEQIRYYGCSKWEIID